MASITSISDLMSRTYGSPDVLDDLCSSSSNEAASDASSDSFARHLRLAASFYGSLLSRRTIHAKRERQEGPKLYEQLEQLRASGLPSDLKIFRRLGRVSPEAFDSLVHVLQSHRVLEQARS
ncbi:hypothetical protein OC834_007154 [Tilletia horrida]|nr:hypothetical protein OC834_007154 [Tilletia horrida]